MGVGNSAGVMIGLPPTSVLPHGGEEEARPPPRWRVVAGARG